jgi:hypothetical protein
VIGGNVKVPVTTFDRGKCRHNGMDRIDRPEVTDLMAAAKA